MPHSLKRCCCLTILSLIFGCGEKADQTYSDAPVSESSQQSHAHNHPSTGPHGGDLIELGADEEFHAELVHDKDDGVTIYILDGMAKDTVAIDATELKINTTHDGTAEQFVLKAAPEEGTKEGMSARFMLQDGHLADHLEDAVLVVKINGKQFRGKIAHSPQDTITQTRMNEVR